MTGRKDSEESHLGSVAGLEAESTPEIPSCVLGTDSAVQCSCPIVHFSQLNQFCREVIQQVFLELTGCSGHVLGCVFKGQDCSRNEQLYSLNRGEMIKPKHIILHVCRVFDMSHEHFHMYYLISPHSSPVR